jgi:hypothetical protein
MNCSSLNCDVLRSRSAPLWREDHDDSFSSVPSVGRADAGRMARVGEARARAVLTREISAAALLALGFSSIVSLFVTGHANADDACLANLPVPTPIGTDCEVQSCRVVQLVNCPNQLLLGTANAAHKVGTQPTSVFPREKP